MLVLPLLFRPIEGIVNRWRLLVELVGDPYRPELHYMRGPGPKWRAKNQATR